MFTDALEIEMVPCKRLKKQNRYRSTKEITRYAAESGTWEKKANQASLCVLTVRVKVESSSLTLLRGLCYDYPNG